MTAMIVIKLSYNELLDSSSAVSNDYHYYKDGRCISLFAVMRLKAEH